MQIKKARRKFIAIFCCLLLSNAAHAVIYRWMTQHGGAPTPSGGFNYAGWDGPWINQQNIHATGGGNSYELGVGSYNGYGVTKPSVTTFGTGSILRNHWVPHHSSGFNVSWNGPIENYGVWLIQSRTFTYAGGRMRHWNYNAQIYLYNGGSFTNDSLFEMVGGSRITGDDDLWFTNNAYLHIWNGHATCSTRLRNNRQFALINNNFTIQPTSSSNSGYLYQTANGTIYTGAYTFNLNARLDNYGNIYAQNGGTFQGTGTIANGRILSNFNGGTIFVTSSGTFNRNGPLYNYVGAIIDVAGGSLTLPNTASYLYNEGHIRIRNGSTVSFPTVSYTNTGTIAISDSVNNITGTIRGTGSALLNIGDFSACSGTTNATISIPNMTVKVSGTNVTFSGAVTVSNLLKVQNGATANFSNNIVLSNQLTVETGGAFNQTSGNLTNGASASTVTNNGTFTDSGGTFSPTFFANNNLATFSNTNFNVGIATNNGTLNINGTTAINSTIINSGSSGTLALGGTSHSITGSIQHVANNSTQLLINCTGNTTINAGATITNASWARLLSPLIINGTFDNRSRTINNVDGYAEIRANISGTGEFKNSNGSVRTDHYSGTVSTSTVSNYDTWNLITGSSPIINSAGFTNYSTGILNLQASTTLAGTVSNNGIIYLYDNCTMSGAITAQNGSTLWAYGPFTQSGTITGAAAGLSTGLFLNSVNGGTHTIGAAVTNIPTIGVYNGTLNIANNVTGVSDQLRIDNSGVTVNVTAVLSGGSGRVINYGTLNFNAGSTFTNFDYLYKYPGSTTSFNTGAAFSINGIDIIGVPSTGAGNLRVTNGTTLQTNAAINGLQTIDLIENSNLTLQSGASCINFSNMNLASGSTIQVNSGASLTVSDSQTLSGDGDIVNSGFFTVDNSNLTLGTGGVGGNFTNNSSGIFYVNGTPTITFAGATFTNNGSILASFSTLNTLPAINASAATTVSLSTGTIIVGYNNNFIAEGEYTLITSNAVLTPSTLGGYVLPQPSRYISSWSLSTNGANANVQVVRDGFGNHATTARGKVIGDYMELLGRSNPTPEQLDLLNALEKIQDDTELNTALVNLFPPESPPIQTMQMISTNLRQVEIRLVNTRQDTLMAAAGDDSYGKHGVWIRPFTSSGHQRDKQDMLGYKAKTKGIAFGIDSEAQHWLTVGIAGSVSKSTVTQNNNSRTYTDISAYQAMVYGTVKSAKDAYFDWILAVGNNNYDGVRNVTMTGYQADAVSDYGGQQITAKVIASRDFELFGYYQLTPHGSAQYSFLRTLGYQENGAGPFNVIVSPNNMNLFRLGLGAELSVPLSDRNYVGIPAVHAGAYVDAGGGVQDTNSMFISGGPIISSKLQPNRLLIKAGASFNLSINDNIELTVNYDLEARRGYTGHEAYLNLRYIF